MHPSVFAPRSRSRRRWLMFTLWASLLLVSVPCLSQNGSDYAAKRQRGLDLYKQSNMVEAAAVLGEVAAANDKDQPVHSALGFALFAMAASEQNEQERARLASRAIKVLTRAKELGDNTTLTDLALSRLQAGNIAPGKFSQNAEADLAMQQGETDFVKGDLAAAIELYKRALKADPKLYDAALYIGDALYKTPGSMDQALEWYAKAIAIDSFRETAYRYWADVLMKQGDAQGARDKYIEAYILEPNNRLAVSGFTTWAKDQHVTLAHPAVTIPTSVSQEKNGNTTITLDPATLGSKSNGDSAWLLYGVTRASWSKEKFKKEYPTETAYRHSLREEADALHMVVSTARADAGKAKASDLDPSLATLLKLDQQGELEAFILLAKSDPGIAQDYPRYLTEHRDKLRAYVVDWVLQGGKGK